MNQEPEQEQEQELFTVIMSAVGERGSAVIHINSAASPHEACDLAKNELETEHLGTEWRMVAVMKGRHDALLLGEDA